MHTLFDTLRRSLPAWLLLTAITLAAGIFRNDLFAQLSGAGLADLIGTFVLALGFAGLVHWRLRIGVARGLMLAFALVLLFRIGLAPVGSVLLIATTALVLGERVFGDEAADPVIAVVLGLALMMGMVGWLLPLPVHHRGIYVLACVLLIGSRWASVRTQLRDLTAPLWRPRMQLGAAAIFALLVIGYIGLPAGLPTAMADDLAYHLALPTDLMTLGYYRMDAQSQVWALAPWGSDVIHGLAQVIAGVEARGAVHWLWFALGLRLLWQLLAQHEVATTWRWLGLALFASQPLQLMLAHSMQTEMPTQTLLLALMLLISRVTPAAGSRLLLALGAVVGALLAMKVITVIYLVPLAIWFLVRWRSPAIHRLIAPAAVMLAVGGSSYAYATVIAGNPFLPLFNDVFGSTLFITERFRDTNYSGGLSFDLPWRMIFDGSNLHEGWNGSGGFQWLFVAVALPWLLTDARTRGFAWIGLGASLLLCLQIQHVRYLLPASMALGIAFTVLLAHRHPRFGLLLVLPLIALNLAFAQTSSWMLRKGTLARYQLRADGVHRFLEDFAPARLLYAPLKAGASPFLVFADGHLPMHAELSGRGVVASHYDIETLQKFMAARAAGGQEPLRALFAEYGATHVLAHARRSPPDYVHALDQIGALDAEIDGARLYRMPSWPAPSAPIPGRAAFAKRIDLAGTQAGEISFSAEVRCFAASDNAISARVFFDGKGWDGARVPGWSLCTHDQPFHFHGRARVKAGYDFADFEIDGPMLGEQRAFSVENLQIEWRRDLTTERDAARRLLGRYR